MPTDLHCHSLFSVDGWSTPEEMADAMAAAGLTTLSLTDHNTLDGLDRCRARARQLGLRFIPGAEFDAMWQGSEYHFLAFGFDPGSPSLRRLCLRQFGQYEANFARFLPILERRCGVTRQALLSGLAGRYRTHPSPVLNKWFARGYLLSQGILADEPAVAREMTAVAAEAERDVAQPWEWAAAEAVRDTVHEAGGVVLLAHPAGYRRGSLRAQLDLIREFLAIGLDGFELYHPANTGEPHFGDMEAEALRLGCAVSGGSDTHCDLSRPVQAPPGFTVPDWVTHTLDVALARRRAG